MNCIKEITGHVRGQRLMLDQPVIVGETIDYLTGTFDFDERWDGTVKFVHFSHGEDSRYVLLNDGKITENQHLNLGSGLWQVWIIGERTEGGEVVQRITTQVQTLRVEKSGVIDGEPFPEDTGSAGEQILAQAVAAKNAAEAAQTAAEAAEATAGNSAGQAATSATGAASSAASAAGSAESAGGSATAAAAAAQAAADAKAAAQESMMSAEGAKEDAEDAASLAAGQARAAAQSADDALGSAQEAEEAAERIEDKTGDLDDLITPHKDNLVEAINDAYNHGGGGGADLPETTNLLKGDGEGGAAAAVPGTDYATPEQVNAKYTKPQTGIPATDLAAGVIPETTEVDAKAIVTSISSISTNNQIPTAAAVYNAVSPKQDKPALVTSGTSITLADNTEYKLTDVTSLALDFPVGAFECWLKITTAASGTFSISFPSGTTYIGTVPQFGVGETWEISIKDGVVVAGKTVAS